MIYATTFDDETKQATAPSADSGFTTIAEVVEAMGPDWLSCSGRAAIYPGVMFSDYEVSI